MLMEEDIELDESVQKEITERQLAWAKKKWGTGGRLFKTREELYE